MGDLETGDSVGLSGRGLARGIPPSGDCATMVTSRNPLVAPQPVAVRPWVRLRDLAPDVPGPLMLRHNGAWLLRKDWGRFVAPGDVIEWHELPQGGNTSRTVLQVVLAYYVAMVGAVYGPLAAVALNIAGNALINAILPLRQPSAAGDQIASPGSVYNVTASGNQARLQQPRPVIYGRHPVFPDYAAQPYIEYIDNGKAGALRTGDQYFFALYCLGEGEYAVDDRDILIDDTPLAHFADVTYRLHPPGWSPAADMVSNRVHPAVSTSPEVAGQALESGRYTGGFSACGPGKVAEYIGVDILFDRLGRANDDGSLGDYSVTVRAEARYIDDYGVPTGAWFRLFQRTYTGATTTPQRYSQRERLPTPGRVEVRMGRIDVRDESSRVFNDPTWGGMRAYLAGPAPLSATATHLEVVIRASEQLSGLSQRKIKVIPRRKLPTWAPGTGWSAPVETRNPAWALADIWRNPVYGDALPSARIDTDTLYALAQVWDARQDRCDIVFDSRTTSWEAARIVARTGRAVPFRRMGVNTLVRDQRQTLPVAAYTTRNMLPGAAIGYALPTEETADGVIAEFFDGRAQEWREVLCRAPGIATPARPVRVRYLGITGRTHAEREGLYESAQAFYRRKFPRWQTELEGLLPAYGSLVVCAPPMYSAIQAGDVVAWDEATRTMRLSEPILFAPGVSYVIALHRDDGSVTPGIAVTPGATEHDVALATLPDFDPTADGAYRERTRYYIGTSEAHRVYTRVLGIRRQGRGGDGAEAVELSGVVEDDRIHDVDVHLLPAAGEVQEPIASPYGKPVIYIGIGPGTSTATGPGGPYSGGGAGDRILVVELFDTRIDSNDASMFASRSTLRLRSNGAADTEASPVAHSLTGPLAGQWLRYAPHETSTTALYEVRATLLSGHVIDHNVDAGDTPLDGDYAAPPDGDPLDVWLPLSLDRSWSYAGPARTIVTVRLRIEIREVSSGVVQAAPTITFTSDNAPAT